MSTYITAFFPSRLPETIDIQPYRLGPTHLRVWLRADDLNLDCSGYRPDMTRLFKLKARFPGCCITWDAFAYAYPDKTLRVLSQIINNDNARWLKLLRGPHISQIRLGVCPVRSALRMSIVVKERYAEAWMKTIPAPRKDVEVFAARVGWDTKALRKDFWVGMGVDYSLGFSRYGDGQL